MIEDAAEAIGSEYFGKRAGCMGRFGAFSFHGSKTVTTGEGGMFVTDDPDLHQRALALSNHGRSRAQQKQFWPDVVGFKYKISNIQAALGCAQMERIDELIRRKREIFHYYRDQLKDIPGVQTNPEGNNTVNGAWMPTAVFDRATGVTREMLRTAFDAVNIDARVFFYPLSGLPMFDEVPANRNARDIPARAINLPSFHDMSRDDQDRVVAVIRQIVSGG